MKLIRRLLNRFLFAFNQPTTFWAELSTTNLRYENVCVRVAFDQSEVINNNVQRKNIMSKCLKYNVLNYLNTDVVELQKLQHSINLLIYLLTCY